MKVLRLPVLAWGVSFVLISVFRQTKQEEADESGE
jgi:hypothetical protein